MNENIKEKLKKGVAYSAILLSVATIGIVGGNTYSKYFTKIDGEGNAKIARWSFRANNTSTVMEKIQLNNVYNTNILKNKTIDNLVNKPTNLKFTYDGTTKSSLEELEDLLKGRITLDDSRTKTLTIYWSWDYQTGTTDEEKSNNDRIDTNDSGKDFSFDMTIT